MDSLRNGGRAGIVVDKGLLLKNQTAFVQTKRKVLDECDLYCIISLPGGVFTQAVAEVKTNLLFFTRGHQTEKTWYYDLSHIEIKKNNFLNVSHFDEFFQLLPARGDSET